MPDMSAAVLSLLAEKGGPVLPTRKGLMLLNLQNDFLSCNGAHTVASAAAIRDSLASLIPDFRQNGTIIWVRTEYDPTASPQTADSIIASTTTPNARPSSLRGSPKHRSALSSKNNPSSYQAVQATADNDELFLCRRRTRGPCCLPGTPGAEYAESIRPLIDRSQDLEVVTNHYSALRNPLVLQALRVRLITELYLAGCVTNTSIYATALDAAAYGIKIVLLDDCLGYRARSLHDLSLHRLNHLIDARLTHSKESPRRSPGKVPEKTDVRRKTGPHSTSGIHSANTEVDSESDSNSDASHPLSIASTRQGLSARQPSPSQCRPHTSTALASGGSAAHRRTPSLPNSLNTLRSPNLQNVSSAQCSRTAHTPSSGSHVRRPDDLPKHAKYCPKRRAVYTATGSPN